MNKPKRRTYMKRYGYEHTERYITALHIYIKQLEQAFDNACEYLASYNCPTGSDDSNCIIPDCDGHCWKEYFLKDEKTDIE